MTNLVNHCTHCGRNNHKTEVCHYSAKLKCIKCKKLGHERDQCRFKKRSKKPRKQKDKLVADMLSLNVYCVERIETLAAPEFLPLWPLVPSLLHSHSLTTPNTHPKIECCLLVRVIGPSYIVDDRVVRTGCNVTYMLKNGVFWGTRQLNRPKPGFAFICSH